MDPGRCRICQSENDCSRDIFTGKCSNGRSYAETLMSCIAGFAVVEDHILSSQICEACASELESWAVCGKIDDDFVSKCTDSNYVSVGEKVKIECGPNRDISMSTENVPVRRLVPNDCSKYSRVEKIESSADTVYGKLADVETEEIEIKTEPDDEYFRTAKNDLRGRTKTCGTERLRCDRRGKHFGSESNGCDFCGTRYVSKRDPARRMLRETCRKTFARGSTPKGERSCDKRFAQRSFPTSHDRVGERPYECGSCGKTFVQKGALTMHSRVHSDEKPHACDICGKRFVLEAMLESHLRTHTDERPYECGTCGRTFAQRVALTSHARSHTGEKSYGCGSCGTMFAQKGALTVHLRMHSDKKRDRKSVRSNGTPDEVRSERVTR